ncbi:ABC transporter ATP-binding protein [Salinicoccus halitifaciens]|uniref:ABC-2 type transport system ATP-binding protein n=1 Tax=Salinicoccus halitifaciens TaxID=1073415 RepID=A0ABV2EDK4_9STAP|nr:ABC transporter ATP-binding protein [Salinicoccus halitifaciens]MCD2138711.1 ABC transporter ATP-binding protein [Salinicoccus halitifaciens]
MSILTLENVSKHFGKVRAAENVSIDIREGEVFGFIGPNGAGKSTTIRMIIGALKETSGTIYFKGEDIKKSRRYIENISYVPGDVNLWPNLTGMEVINFFMKMRGFKDVEMRDALIEKFRLDARKKCKTYSKGNRQKVALISALLSDADLLIFDEPTTGLDPLMERVFHQEILAARDAGKSVLLSSHILSEVEKLADRIAIIREGKIIETGKLADLSHITRIEYILSSEDDLSFLEGKSYAHDFRTEGGNTHLMVDNDKVADFMSDISSKRITYLVTEPPKLEDIFMRYYEDKS